MSAATNSTQSSEEATSSRQARPQAGGLLDGEQNQGAERLTSQGGPLGGTTDSNPGASVGKTAGDASGGAGVAHDTAESTRDDARERKKGSADGGDFDDGEEEGAADRGQQNEENKVPVGAKQSDAVNKMLAEAEQRVKENHDTDHPETEEKNKKIIEQQKEEEKKKHPPADSDKKEGLMGKIKGVVHHEKS